MDRNTRMTSFDDDEVADKQRLQSFSFGGGAPAAPSKRSHGRSHSRNTSVSLSLSAVAPPAVPGAPLSPSFSAPSFPQGHHASNSSLSARNSHHRRRSSVSTRRESAEMMGVELPQQDRESNINLGDKDSVRRRALWALEGKGGADNFAPVEIPVLNTPELERRLFELPSKSSFPQVSSFGSGMSGLAGKRDSFGNHLAPSASNKDQLHTLVEEEEEEEETELLPGHVVPEELSPASTVTPTETTTRPRPAGLTLRPLSLNPENFVAAYNPDFPQPSPSIRPGLRTLTLASSPPVSASTSNKRSSLTMASPVVAVPSSGLFRRSSLTYRTDSMSSISSEDAQSLSRKRSSISYKPQVTTSNLFGLPTPESTPTSERRVSLEAEEHSRNLETEHQFLAQSHAVLLTRIADLERALKSRSRPQSMVSDSSYSEPSDELLQLIADLKAERDELKKDCTGWRTRVADLEKQTGVLAKRVDVERREAWVARERMGLLEVEKRAIARQAEEAAALAASLEARHSELVLELEEQRTHHALLQEEARKGQEALDESSRLRALLSEETRRREILERELECAGLLGTPQPPQIIAPTPRRWESFGSESSATDVESVDHVALKGLGLGAVAEVDEEQSYTDEEDNDLEHYEDEGDDDLYVDDDVSESSSVSSFHAPEPVPASKPTPTINTHTRGHSLVRAWAFPTRVVTAPEPSSQDEVDRFFGCLDDLENSPPVDYAPASRIGNPFATADEDEMMSFPPFVLPADVGIEVFDATASFLDKISEEDEEEDQYEDGSEDDMDDEFIGEEDEGGIKFTFEIPPEFQQPPSPVPSPSSTVVATPASANIPMMDDEDAAFTFAFTPKNQATFNFETPKHAADEPKMSSSPSTPSSISRGESPASSPSGIPRSTSLRKFAATRTSPPSAPLAVSIPAPSPKARPSFIPQPSRFSPSAPAKPTFVPAPIVRKPLANTQAASQIVAPRSQQHGTAPSPRAILSISPIVSPRSTWGIGSFLPTMWSPKEKEVGPEPGTAGFMALFGPKQPQESKPPSYVSKERQLARLRVRMEEERTKGKGTHGVQCGPNAGEVVL
ncbi:hypothetical protein PENSPDRAFT_684668 [Peniophora sp. CONT]|nr:hypothetical protein PENSPDRAFT_684668 [Peniophora sp. CONT]